MSPARDGHLDFHTAPQGSAALRQHAPNSIALTAEKPMAFVLSHTSVLTLQATVCRYSLFFQKGKLNTFLFFEYLLALFFLDTSSHHPQLQGTAWSSCCTLCDGEEDENNNKRTAWATLHKINVEMIGSKLLLG